MKAKSAKAGSSLTSYRETVVLVELDQPQCSLSYGTAPCTAALGTTGPRKCFNTRKTCQDAPHYTPVPLTLTFGRDQLETPRYYGAVIPSLGEITTTPGQINLGGMDKSSAALGQREVVSLTLDDHLYSDLLVDKYRLERASGGATPSQGEVHFDFLAGTLKAAHGAELATLGFARSGVATRVNAAGFVEVVAADAPRYDYDPETRAQRGLLVEETRTNILRQSANFSVSPWALAGGATLTPNASTAPDGTLTATRLNASSGSSEINQPMSGLTIGNIYTFSAYLKAGTVGRLILREPIIGVHADVNLATGTATLVGPGLTVSILPVGGGWQRASVSFQATSTSAQWTTRANNAGALDLWGQQVEVGLVPSSYIPTTTAAVTRGNDLPIVADISKFYNVAEGTLVVEFMRPGPLYPDVGVAGTRYPWVVAFDDGTSAERLGVFVNDPSAGNQVSVLVRDGNVNVVNNYASAAGVGVTLGAVMRTAFSWKLNEFQSSTNGSAGFTDSVGTLPTVNRFGLGGDVAVHGHIRRVTYYPRALTAAQVVALSQPGASAPLVVPFAGLDSPPEDTGTFWGKWLARNPFHQGDALRVLEGKFGDPRSALRVRHYVVDNIEGPTDGKVTLTAKDRFSLIEAQRAVAPKPSEGELLADIIAAATSATLNPTGVGVTYPASGHVAIGKEICGFTRAGDVLTLTRAQKGTTAEDHKAEDLVQLVLTYTTQQAQNIIYDLLTSYTTLDAALIDKPEWDLRAASVPDLYTASIAEPNPVADLIGEICEQAGLSVWHDPRSNMIELRAMRPAEASPTVTDREWILDGSISVKRQDDRRVSEVWVYYGQRNPLASLDETQNYHSRFLDVDLDAEADTEYGVPEIRRVFSRWIPQFGRGSAQRTARRLLTMFRDPPLEATFRIDASRDGELELARYFALSTAEVQDETGGPALVSMACVRIGRGENELSINAQAVNFGTEEDPGSPRFIYIEEDAQNLNMRDIHDGLFSPPVEGVPLSVSFVIESGVYVYSDTVTLPAIKTGPWPVDVTLSLENRGFIMGRGGDGASVGTTVKAAQAGGNAIELNHTLTLDNTNGYVLAGGGGGGGFTHSFSIDGGGPGPFGCGGGGAAGGGKGGDSNEGSGVQLGGLGGLPGLPGADGVIFGTYNCQASAAGGGRVPEGAGGVGAVSFTTGAAPTKATGAPCGGGGGLATDEGNTSGGNGGNNLSNGANATVAGGSTESAAGGGGGWGMSGGNAAFSAMGSTTTLLPGMGPGKAVALNGNVLTWAGSAPSQTSPKVRGAVS